MDPQLAFTLFALIVVAAYAVQTAIGFGSVAKANKDGFGVIDSIKVFVPTP